MNINCPNCHTIMSKIQLEKVVVDHCNSCGGTLFDYNEINRISLQDAEKLSLMKETDVISGTEKFSPRDGSILKRIEGDAVPQSVTLLRSDTTQEVFAYPDDLVEFKTAQNAKLDYFKAWKIPLPALQSVLVFSFLIAISLSTVYLASRIQRQGTHAIQASDLCVNGLTIIGPDESVSDPRFSNYVVSCNTSVNMTCKVEAKCLGEVADIVMSNAPTRIHTAFVPTTCSTVKIVCNDNGSILESETQPLGQSGQ